MTGIKGITIPIVNAKTIPMRGDAFPAILKSMKDQKKPAATQPKYPAAFLELLEAKGFDNISQLEKAAKVAHSTVRKVFERAEKSQKPARMIHANLAKVARALGESPAYVAQLMNLAAAEDYGRPFAGDDPEDTADFSTGPVGRVLPVRHRVEAGKWLQEDGELYIEGGPRILPDPAYPATPDDQWLEIVSGDSMDLLAPQGTYLHVLSWDRVDRQPRDGDLVVVTRVGFGGQLTERTFKRARKTNGRVEFWPESSNPKHSGPIALGEAENGDMVHPSGLVLAIIRRM